MDNPCYHCNDRTINCHFNCEQYKSWQSSQEEFLKAIHKEDSFKDYERQRMKRYLHYKNKRRKY